jgi:hypothetical protein
MFMEEKVKFEQEKRELKIKQMKDGNNIWSHVKQIFRPYTSSFKGLTTNNEILKDNKQIIDQLANYYENHLQLPSEYLNRITVLFNKCAEAGDFFEKGKVAKGIFLSKDGAYPTESRLRSYKHVF